MAGFSVDLGALDQAAQGINATLTQIDTGSVSDYAGNPAEYGDPDLAATVADFSNRWQTGVDTLATDAQTTATLLTACAAGYRASETAAQQQFTGILHGSGPDPAAGS